MFTSIILTHSKNKIAINPSLYAIIFNTAPFAFIQLIDCRTPRAIWALKVVIIVKIVDGTKIAVRVLFVAKHNVK